MAEVVTEGVASLVKRMMGHLGRKASSILMLLYNNKNASSFGALAGFTLAIVFAWKFLRSPDRLPRRKRRNDPPSGRTVDLTNVELSDSDVLPHLLNASDMVVPQLNLGQFVRKMLNGGRRVTCQLLGIILEERTPAELQKHVTVRSSALEVLFELTKLCDLYLMETVENDESEERILVALEDAGVFKTGDLVKEKVLFCSTEIGRSSFVRQLEPDWHIDTNREIVSNLARFIRFQLHVSPTAPSFVASNVSTSSSLEQYFSPSGVETGNNASS